MSTYAAAIVLAGGTSSRFGANHNKVYAQLGRQPVLRWSLQVFAGHQAIKHLVVVYNEDDVLEAENIIAHLKPREVPDLESDAAKVEKVQSGDVQVPTVESPSHNGAERADLESSAVQGTRSTVPIITLVPGGPTRAHSEHNGLKVLSEYNYPDEMPVLIHDGARPFITAELLDQLINHVQTTGNGVVPGQPLGTPILTTAGHMVDASNLRSVQTPQAFPLAVALQAHQLREQSENTAESTGYDTAQVVADELKTPVDLLYTNRTNFKITTQNDLALANAFCERLRSS